MILIYILLFLIIIGYYYYYVFSSISVSENNRNAMDVNRYFPDFTKENTEINRSFSGDYSLFSGVSTKENTEKSLVNEKIYDIFILLILGIIIIIIIYYIKEYYNDYLLKKNGLVNINDINPTILTDMRYYTKNNFMKEKLYKNNKCMLQKKVANKLSKIHENLKKKFNIKLKVYDCYRPKFIQKQMFDKIHNTKYVNNPNNANHCKGTAVDLTLTNTKGQELKMPSKFNDFSIKSVNNCNKNTIKYKKILDKYMLKEGFTKNKHEWWHYNYNSKKKYPNLNIPI